MKITQTAQFKKDIRKQRKRGNDIRKLQRILERLVAGKALSAKNRDDALSGNQSGWRDCHLEPDWLLLYKRLPNEIVLGRTGTHSDLF